MRLEDEFAMYEAEAKERELAPLRHKHAVENGIRPGDEHLLTGDTEDEISRTAKLLSKRLRQDYGPEPISQDEHIRMQASAMPIRMDYDEPDQDLFDVALTAGVRNIRRVSNDLNRQWNAANDIRNRMEPKALQDKPSNFG